jgi:hypothetical protein
MTITGVLAIALGLLGLSAWWWSVVEMLRGVTPIVLLLFGLIALAAGLSSLHGEREVSDEEFFGEGS